MFTLASICRFYVWGQLFEARLALTVDSIKMGNKLIYSLNNQTKMFQPD